ncbi:MAG TPA: lipoyl(octanoyl) transferase LipB [Devosiaceae bacterium]|nr:lipoyl(octanoyl) transferase LipB [Devosiaceae bacterium]
MRPDPARTGDISVSAGASRAVADSRISVEPVGYEEALAAMTARVDAIAADAAPELVWLLEHPPLYTAGTSADPRDLIDPDLLPVFRTGRGGQFTYHGPGQRVAYTLLDLRRRGRDVRALVRGLEEWIITALAEFAIEGKRRQGCVGVWIDRPEKGAGRQDKIAAIGVRVSRWISFHGISVNLDPDLAHYRGIVPCGIAGQEITSIQELGQIVSMPELDMALRTGFETVFGPVAEPEYA